jgi:hypothetical protein
MTVFDIEAIRSMKQQKEDKEREAIKWCAQAAGEFAEIAKSIGTDAGQAKPSYWSEIGDDYKTMFSHGKVYNVLVDNSFDNTTHNEVSGSNIAEDGTLWRGGKEKNQRAFGTYIASACHYSIPVAQRLFEAAFLNAPWTVNRALGETE